jgi:hypothetical protein
VYTELRNVHTPGGQLPLGLDNPDVLIGDDGGAKSAMS